MLHVHVGVSKCILRMNHGNIDEFWEMSLSVFFKGESTLFTGHERPVNALRTPKAVQPIRFETKTRQSADMNLIIPNTNSKSSYTYCISNPNPLDKLSSSCLMLLYSNGPKKKWMSVDAVPVQHITTSSGCVYKSWWSTTNPLMLAWLDHHHGNPTPRKLPPTRNEDVHIKCSWFKRP